MCIHAYVFESFSENPLLKTNYIYLQIGLNARQ